MSPAKVDRVVLILDGIPESVRLYTTLLGDDFTPIPVEDPDEAWIYFEHGEPSPAALLVDPQSISGDERALIRRIHACSPTFPVIVISSALNACRDHLQSERIAFYLSKDSDLSLLRNLLHFLLHGINFA